MTLCPSTLYEPMGRSWHPGELLVLISKHNKRHRPTLTFSPDANIKLSVLTPISKRPLTFQKRSKAYLPPKLGFNSPHRRIKVHLINQAWNLGRCEFFNSSVIGLNLVGHLSARCPKNVPSADESVDTVFPQTKLSLCGIFWWLFRKFANYIVILMNFWLN